VVEPFDVKYAKKLSLSSALPKLAAQRAKVFVLNFFSFVEFLLPPSSSILLSFGGGK
jgi:hypothetical protein